MAVTDDAKALGKINGQRNTLAIAVLSALLGSGGGVALVFNTGLGQNLARPDPFTGTQAAALTTRIEHLEDNQNLHLRSHPDQAGRFDARIMALEAQNAVMIQNQTRILNRLDTM